MKSILATLVLLFVAQGCATAQPHYRHSGDRYDSYDYVDARTLKRDRKELRRFRKDVNRYLDAVEDGRRKRARKLRRSLIRQMEREIRQSEEKAFVDRREFRRSARDANRRSRFESRSERRFDRREAKRDRRDFNRQSARLRTQIRLLDAFAGRPGPRATFRLLEQFERTLEADLRAGKRWRR
ncbi:MAG: hypothetical protein AAGI08_06275 [Bacteroidota bacterium]